MLVPAWRQRAATGESAPVKRTSPGEVRTDEDLPQSA
jgi:hypothetical protein